MCVVKEIVELSAEKVKYFHDLYTKYRDYIQHEDYLINQRITWLISIQSFLIATFGFSYQKKFEILSLNISKVEPLKDTQLEKFNDLISKYDTFLIILTIIGIAVSIIALLSTNAAHSAIDVLSSEWKKISPDNGLELPGIIGGGSKKAHRYGKVLAELLPWFFLGIWLFVLLSIRIKWV